MSLALTQTPPADALPFLADLIGYLAEWEAAHAAAIQKTFLFVHPQTNALYYAVIGTAPIHDVDTTLLEEVVELSLGVQWLPRFAGVDFEGEFFLRDSLAEMENLSRGMVEVRREG